MLVLELFYYFLSNFFYEIEFLYLKIQKEKMDQYIVKGYVQSGKTNFIIQSTLSFLKENFSVIIIVRDRKSDREQLFRRFKNAGIKIGKNIHIVLGNASSISKIDKDIDNYILFIDEVDFVDNNHKSKKYKCIQTLKENANRVFGISATVMDSLGKDNIDKSHLILIDKPKLYKGIEQIEMIEIKDAVFSGKVKSDLFELDQTLLLFIDSFVTRKPYKEHPHICLITNSRTKHPCEKAQLELSKIHHDLSTIVYNGDGISYCKGETCIKQKKSISYCLQMLKNEGVEKHPHILIFAGDLAGRSISFTSEDYLWHLTDQRLLISNTCDEPELIQKVRLCGIYNDDIPLRLYSTKETLSDLRKSFFRQEEIIESLKESEMKSYDFINSMEMNQKKLTHRHIVKDRDIHFQFKKVDKEVGWPMEDYKLENNLESKLELDLELVIKKIKKYRSNVNSYISIFFSSINPQMTFTKEELLDVLKKSGYQQPQSYIKSLLGKTTYGFGHCIFDYENKKYKIKKELEEAFE